MPSNDYKLVIHADRTPAGEHERRYNSPNVNEIAAVITNEECAKRDIVLQRQNNRLQRISEIHPSYDALQYPLIFWKGEDGYDINYKQINANGYNICALISQSSVPKNTCIFKMPYNMI
ncbi:LOC105227208 [Sergentomyia squamirostris]